MKNLLPLFYSLFLLSCAHPNLKHTALETAPYAGIKLGMYADANCDVPLKQQGEPFVLLMDTAQKCFDFSYVDPSEDNIPTSHANFRCFRDYILYDKYPFSADCSTVERVAPTINYRIGNECQFADSHEGGVYEKLIEYQHPGTVDCIVVE
ncbi:hypothetical protein [Teredinibacter franksiae]|uniref:hypothetical protein n=1 Tax=Teredinibacter franksiae TaxID=2761453 RepID=UPI0016293EB2|nr:hypothetical protein [Teredinibacter franksiae]